MSRVIVFGLDNTSVGAFTATCNRGWTLLGNPGVNGGGETTVTVPDEVISQPWLQLGRMVLVERPPLPPWAGMIDTPWKAAPLPAELTLYNAECLFGLRAAERSVQVIGSMSDVIREMIRIVNEQESTVLHLGNATSSSQTLFNRVIEQRNIWAQLVRLLEESGYEMVLRPERNASNELHIYADIGVQLGTDTGFLLHDGEQPNMRVIEARVNGDILNRITGVSGQSTEDDQLQTAVLEDQDSQNAFRTRSDVLQFRNVTEIAMLTTYAQAHLDYGKRPYLDLTVDVMDVGETFTYLREGNRCLVHAAHVYLPGGIRGWRGIGRILAMVIDEKQNTVRTTLRGIL